MGIRARASVVAAVLAVALGAGLIVWRTTFRGEPGLRYERLADPARTVVRDETETVLAILTDGARTAVFRGPERTIAEPSTTTATVSTLAVARLAPQPWQPGDESSNWFQAWFPAAMTSTEPDLIDLALQYGPDATERIDDKGIRYAGRATFGPIESGERLESSDFNDYLGIDWTFPDGPKRTPKPSHRGALDCSGFVRAVFGYRSGYPLEFAPPTGRALPRRAVMMAESGPGVVVIPAGGRPATQLDRLQTGDLLFFDADPGDGPTIDHVGIYLGIDSAGRHRFMSSRKTANGPTLGDVGGASVLDGTGLYASGFRSARRL